MQDDKLYIAGFFLNVRLDIGRIFSRPTHQCFNDQTISLLQKVVVSILTSFWKRAKDMKFAFNLVILNVIHIFLTSPAIIVSAIQFTDLQVYLIVYVISHFFFSLNFALHFGVHFCVNSVFRKEFLTLIRFKNS